MWGPCLPRSLRFTRPCLPHLRSAPFLCTFQGEHQHLQLKHSCHTCPAWSLTPAPSAAMQTPRATTPASPPTGAGKCGWCERGVGVGCWCGPQRGHFAIGFATVLNKFSLPSLAPVLVKFLLQGLSSHVRRFLDPSGDQHQGGARPGYGLVLNALNVHEASGFLLGPTSRWCCTWLWAGSECPKRARSQGVPAGTNIKVVLDLAVGWF